MKHYIVISLTSIIVLAHCTTIQSNILDYFPDIGLENAIDKLCNKQIDILDKKVDAKIKDLDALGDKKIDIMMQKLNELKKDFNRDSDAMIRTAYLCIPAAIAGTIFGYEAYKGIKNLFYKLYKKLTTKQSQKKSIKKNDDPSALEINKDSNLTVLDFIDPIFNTTLLTCCIAAILNSDTIVRQTSLQAPCAQPAQ